MARPKGRRNKKMSGGINSDELGDDCERDSDLVESDGEDDGEDLVDFIVSDNHLISSMPDASSPSSGSRPAPPSRSKQQYYVPTMPSATQESDGMPDIKDIAGEAGRNGKERGQRLGAARANSKGRATRQVIDSDSDE
jgi:ATP-dependent DNA helicase MPH1